MDDLGRKTLDFEAGRWWRYLGAKEQQVRAEFGESLTRYYARLGVLLDDPEAVAYDAVTVGRLRRLRDARRAVRRRRD